MFIQNKWKRFVNSLSLLNHMYYEFVVFSLFGFVIFFCLISHSSTMCFEGSTDVSYVELIYPDYKTVNTFNSTGLGCIPKSIVKAWNTASILFAPKDDSDVY